MNLGREPVQRIDVMQIESSTVSRIEKSCVMKVREMVKVSRRTIYCALAILLSLIFSIQGYAAVAEYTYSCWLNGWRKNANDRSADIFGIETSHYGFTLDVADFRKVGLGQLNNPAGYEQALEHKAEKLKQLPQAELLLELEVDGVRYRANACRAGQEKGVKHLSHVRLWESGRYVQHFDFLGLDLRDVEGETLACDATLDLVAWPGSPTLNLDVSPASRLNGAVLRLALTSQMGSWSQEQKVEGSWQQGERKSVSWHCPVASARDVPPEEITVTTANDQRFPVRFDVTKNCYVASVKRLKRNWKTGYTDIRRYDEFKISVKGSGSKGAVPFLLDLRPPANITGLCPMLCDESGRPTGISVQLSKNWHYKPMGSYLMAYTMLPAEKDTTYLLRVVYGFYLGRTHHYATPRIAYGNRDGCVEERVVPETLKADQLLLDNVELTGSAPWWVALPGAIHTSGRNWGTGYRALIIRDYRAVVGSKTYTHPTISAPVFTGNPTNLDIDLLPPQGVTHFNKGDRLELDLELITLPRTADDYYGPNEAFRKHLAEHPNSWRTTYREAKGNDLNLVVTGGRALRNYPIAIHVDKPEVTVTIRGGIGVVPIRFEGFESSKGYRLYRAANGTRIKLDQSVHGHDFWQTDYDATTNSYTMTFNLPLDGLDESEWILAR